MGKFFRGIFAGGLGGFLAGLLLAPQRGEESRQQLKQKAEEVTERVKRMSEDLKQKALEIKDRFTKREEEAAP